MPPRSNQVILAGSVRATPRGRFVGRSPKREQVTVTVLLRPASRGLRNHVLELATQEPSRATTPVARGVPRPVRRDQRGRRPRPSVRPQQPAQHGPGRPGGPLGPAVRHRRRDRVGLRGRTGPVPNPDTCGPGAVRPHLRAAVARTGRPWRLRPGHAAPGASAVPHPPGQRTQGVPPVRRSGQLVYCPRTGHPVRLPPGWQRGRSEHRHHRARRWVPGVRPEPLLLDRRN